MSLSSGKGVADRRTRKQRGQERNDTATGTDPGTHESTMAENNSTATAEVELEDSNALLSLTGPGNSHLKSLQKHLGIELGSRGNVLRIGGDPEKVALAERFI